MIFLLMLLVLIPSSYALEVKVVDQNKIEVTTDDGISSIYTIRQLDHNVNKQCKSAVRLSQELIFKEQACIVAQSVLSKAKTIIPKD